MLTTSTRPLRVICAGLLVDGFMPPPRLILAQLLMLPIGSLGRGQRSTRILRGQPGCLVRGEEVQLENKKTTRPVLGVKQTL